MQNRYLVPGQTFTNSHCSPQARARHSVHALGKRDSETLMQKNHRSTHRPQVGQFGHSRANLDSSLPANGYSYTLTRNNKGSANVLQDRKKKQIKKERSFEDYSSKSELESEKQYIIIPAKNRNKQIIIEYPKPLDSQQEYFEHPTQKIIIKPSSIKKQNKRNNPQSDITHKKQQPSNNPNHVKLERASHKHKRSEMAPTLDHHHDMSHKQHRRLATTHELTYEDDSSKAEQIQEFYREQQNDCDQEIIQKIQGFCQSKNNHKHHHEANFYKNKQIRSEKLQKQIQARFRDIEDILEVQNQNLRQHNKYLLAVIKKMQSKQRVFKVELSKKDQQLKKVSEEKDAYIERCLQLQQMVHEKANFNRTSIQQSTKLNDFRDHLKNTIQKKPRQNTYVTTPVSQQYFHTQTPAFISKNHSPEGKRSVHQATYSQISKKEQSDEDSTEFHEQSGIQNSGEASENWVATNSGYSVVKTLSNHMNKNSQIQQLNSKFEDLIAIYRVNHDKSIRKQCVQISNKIKQLKSMNEEIQQIEFGSSQISNQNFSTNPTIRKIQSQFEQMNGGKGKANRKNEIESQVSRVRSN